VAAAAVVLAAPAGRHGDRLPPIFWANVAFAKRFAESDSSRAAFGVNLLGAILGGCLEYAALLTGYRNLLVVVAGLYLLAFLLKPRAGGPVRG
jgi:hypothetical protein